MGHGYSEAQESARNLMFKSAKRSLLESALGETVSLTESLLIKDNEEKPRVQPKQPSTMKSISKTAELVIAIHLICSIQNRLAAAFTFQRLPYRQSTASTRRHPSFLNSAEVQGYISKKEKRKYQKVLETKDPFALTFSGEIIKTSRPLASHADATRLVEFFKTPNARDQLFVSDSAPQQIVPIPKDLLEMWKAEAQSLGAEIPDPEGDVVFQLSSDAISFSGLNVQTTVYCGAKLLESENSEDTPAYEFTMIKDMTKADGPKFLLWIYNQIMDFASRHSSKDKTTRSICLVTLVDSNEGTCVRFESSFQAKLKFPQFILKLMPISKERAEKQGSSAVSNFVEKGVIRALDRFENTFKQQYCNDLKP